MSTDINASHIAARIRGLIGPCTARDLEAAATRLGVSEVALRISIDELSPHPSIDVIAAVIRFYGVDPAWLVSGEYDTSVHRAALDDDAALTDAGIAKLLARQLALRPGITPPPDQLES